MDFPWSMCAMIEKLRMMGLSLSPSGMNLRILQAPAQSQRETHPVPSGWSPESYRLPPDHFSRRIPAGGSAASRSGSSPRFTVSIDSISIDVTTIGSAGDTTQPHIPAGPADRTALGGIQCIAIGTMKSSSSEYPK